MGSHRFSIDRVLHTIPELDKADKRAGATFVNILFGLVVTTTALHLSAEAVKGWAEGWGTVSETRLAHLAVAMTVTVLSWIGYHQSQQYPPFLIKFLNIPFFQFILDVTMVIAYYALTALAEGSYPSQTPDARPEAVVVLFVFILYIVWDHLGFLLFRDSEYTSRLETPRDPEDTLGPRRWVTLSFFLCAAALLIVVISLHPKAPGPILAADGAIIVLLLSYRLLKQAFDPKVKTRSAT